MEEEGGHGRRGPTGTLKLGNAEEPERYESQIPHGSADEG